MSKLFRRLMSLKPNARIASYGEKDVWAIFTPLANKHNSVNLGQGFPNIPAADFIKKAVADSVNENFNQYSPSRGSPHLLEVLSKFYSPLFGREIDPKSEVMISQGANQGIFAIFQTYLEPEDEVIFIEPYFDIYRPAVTLNGGKIVSVPLRLSKSFKENISANDWKLDMKELKSKITKKTKFLLLNTPHNPSGKVFSQKELEEIADIAKEHNIYILSDEVYDQIYFESEHKRIASIPGMWERTITVCSAGKAFGVTGWRVGWLFGPKELIKNVVSNHARTVFCVATPLQEAVARSFEKATELGYFEQQRQLYKKQRDKLVEIFGKLGIPVAVTQGSYFLMANTENLQIDAKPIHWEEFSDPNIMEPHDYTVCRWLTTEIGVTAIPPSSFYDSENRDLARNLARFCFCKTDETISAAEKRLSKLSEYLIKK